MEWMKARQILYSQGNPTIEVDLVTDKLYYSCHLFDLGVCVCKGNTILVTSLTQVCGCKGKNISVTTMTIRTKIKILPKYKNQKCNFVSFFL